MALVASGNIVVADTAADPTAVKSENGKYLDKEGNPTFKVAPDGISPIASTYFGGGLHFTGDLGSRQED